MKVTTERIPDSQAVLTIEVEDELVAKYLERAYRKVVNRVNIHGFRRGKAPRYIVERTFGKEMLFHEGVDLLFPDVFKSAVEETGLKPFDAPQWEISQEQPLIVKVTVPLEPTVQLGNYKDIRLARETVEVTDEEVRAVLERLQEQQTTWVPVERPSEMGDRATIDIDGSIKEESLLQSAGGAPLVTRKGEQLLKRNDVEYPVKEQPDSLLPGFAEQLVGLSDGDEREFTIRLGDNYPEEKFAGKEAIFHVACKGVKERHTPELDDEFAKTVGDFETLDAVRDAIRQDMLNQKTAESEKRFVDNLVGMVVDRSTIEMPPSLVEHEVDHSVEDFSNRLKESGLTMERYLAMGAGKTLEQVRDEFRVNAKRRMAAALALAEVAKAENIEVSQEELEAEIHRMVEGLAGDEAEKASSMFDNPEVKKNISYKLWDRKVIGRLVEIATSEGEPELAAPAEETEQVEPALEASTAE